MWVILSKLVIATSEKNKLSDKTKQTNKLIEFGLCSYLIVLLMDSRKDTTYPTTML